MSSNTFQATVVCLLASYFTIRVLGNRGNSYLPLVNDFYAENQAHDIQDPYLRTLDHFLSMISFESQDQCMEVMCAPRSGVANFKGPVYFKKVANAKNKSRSFSGDLKQNLRQSHQIDDLLKALGDNSGIVYDEMGNVVGVTGKGVNNPSGDFGLSIPKVPGLQPNTDVCCITEEAYFINSTLTDIFGVQRVISQDWQRGSLQFIRHGFCGTHGICPGECTQMYVNLPLIISPPDPGQLVTFKFFKVPGYCSCKVPRNG